ncbi:hypothetical protein GCM10022206_89910 [Streptomyces chiangmaiensis]
MCVALASHGGPATAATAPLVSREPDRTRPRGSTAGHLPEQLPSAPRRLRITSDGTEVETGTIGAVGPAPGRSGLVPAEGDPLHGVA